MPNQPNDRCHRDTERARRDPASRARFPAAQARYRSNRALTGGAARWSWRELDELPAGTSTRRGLGTR